MLEESPAAEKFEAARARVSARRKAALTAKWESSKRRLTELGVEWHRLALMVLAGALCGFSIYLSKTHDESFKGFLNWALFGFPATGAAFGFLLYQVNLASRRTKLRDQVNMWEARLREEELKKLQETLQEDFFTKLVEINFKYIDQYYSQTQAQADKSFSMSAKVAIAGFAVVVAGILLMFVNQGTPGYVTAASGVLGEFIAAVFFYLYNRTILKMSEYHQKLVFTQNVSIALKIAEGLPQVERVKAQRELILRLTENINRYLTQGATSDMQSKPRKEPRGGNNARIEQPTARSTTDS
jgi:hypothetical protein